MRFASSPACETKQRLPREEAAPRFACRRLTVRALHGQGCAPTPRKTGDERTAGDGDARAAAPGRGPLLGRRMGARGKESVGADLPVTAYVRDAALGRELAAGSQVVAELRRLGGLQEHLFTEGNGVGSSEYAKVLVAITDAIERIAAGAAL